MDILPSPDLRLAACTLARDFLLTHSEFCTSESLLELEESLTESHDIFNEFIFQSLATIRNGLITILNEEGDLKCYSPNPDMQQILLKGKEHPLLPQEPITLLHRTSTRPLHFDATQPTYSTSSPATSSLQSHPKPPDHVPPDTTHKSSSIQEPCTITDQPPNTNDESTIPSLPFMSDLTNSAPDDTASPNDQIQETPRQDEGIKKTLFIHRYTTRTIPRSN
jgi:hypothetical protein